MPNTKKNVVITVTDAALAKIQTVADELAAKGLTVDQVMPVTGVITGSCAAGKKAALRGVSGVHSLEDDVQVRLPPSDSDVQ